MLVWLARPEREAMAAPPVGDLLRAPTGAFVSYFLAVFSSYQSDSEGRPVNLNLYILEPCLFTQMQ